VAAGTTVFEDQAAERPLRVAEGILALRVADVLPAKEAAEAHRALLGVLDVVVPPFVVWVGAGWLEACPVADLDAKVTDVSRAQAGGVGIGVQQCEGAQRLPGMAFGAQRAGLAVIGNELKPPPGANGGYQAIGPARFPLILGADFVGIIEATGAGRFSPGERVFGELPITPIGSGTYAERVAVTEDAPLLPKSGTSATSSTVSSLSLSSTSASTPAMASSRSST
jgi:hypothetical protein